MTCYEFFHVISREDLTRIDFELPNQFVKLHGASLQRSVRLKTHCGSEWAIKVVKRHKELWLQRGWSGFTKHFALEFGHMLCFRYKGNSVFKVSISNVTTCPKQSDKDSLPRKKMRTYGANEGYKAFFHLMVYPSTVSRHLMELPSKFWKRHLAGKADEILLQDSNGRAWPVRIWVRNGKRPRPYFAPWDFKEFVVAQNLAIGDKCTFELVTVGNAVSFKVSIARNVNELRIRRTKVGGKGTTNLPGSSNVAAKTTPQEEERANSPGHCHNAANIARPVKVEDCSEDECTILKPADQSGVKRGRGRPKKKIAEKSYNKKQRLAVKNTTAFKEAEKFKSKKPFFRATICRGHSYNTTVRYDFGEAYFAKGYQTVNLQAGRKSWPVILSRGSSGFWLSKGFSKFVRDNDLLPGDICVYELVKRVKPVLRVHFFRNDGLL